MIQDNVPVTSDFYARDEAEKRFGFRLYQGGYVPGKTIRVIEVKGFDVEACGGLHVHSTGEIGFIKVIKRENIKDGVERLVYSTGLPAVELIHQKEELLNQAAQNLSVPVHELPSSTEKFFQEWKSNRKELNALKEKMVDSFVRDLRPQAKKGRAGMLFDNLSSALMIKLGQKVLDEQPKAVVLLGSKKDGSLVVMSGKEAKEKAVALFKEIAKDCQGVGGGNDRLAQGRMTDLKRLEKALS
jgi:alanyl-tRNA synthetase